MVRKLSEKAIAVIGAGKMGETLIKAMLDDSLVDKSKMIATARHQARLQEIAGTYGIQTTTDNMKAVQGADIVLLCIKPQGMREVLEQLKFTLRADQLLISIVASGTTAFIEARLDNKVPVVRAMPNTPSLVGAGMTALCAGEYANDGHVKAAKVIFEHIGRVMVLDEKYFDAVTGLSASGPAFFYIIIESMAEGGVKAGLPRHVATELAAQTCLGAAKMVIETGQHPALLKDAVTTPAGCTIDGILKMEEGGIRVTLIKTIAEAAERAKELIDG